MRFKRKRSLQKFVAVHASVHNHFIQGCSFQSRENFKVNLTVARAKWRGLVVA